MAEGATVIPFPAMANVRTCWDCRWHVEVADLSGMSSHCHLFSEPIEDEGQGDDCEGWDG